jgi:hypothetical protein
MKDVAPWFCRFFSKLFPGNSDDSFNLLCELCESLYNDLLEISTTTIISDFELEYAYSEDGPLCDLMLWRDLDLMFVADHIRSFTVGIEDHRTNEIRITFSFEFNRGEECHGEPLDFAISVSATDLHQVSFRVVAVDFGAPSICNGNDIFFKLMFSE